MTYTWGDTIVPLDDHDCMRLSYRFSNLGKNHIEHGLIVHQHIGMPSCDLVKIKYKSLEVQVIWSITMSMVS